MKAVLQGDAVSGFSLQGELKHPVVSTLPRQLPNLSSASGEVSCTLGKVSFFDSSLLALMLEWYHDARSRRVSLRYTDIPASLRSLIATYRLGHLLAESG
jgi:ABC-type transporter Mla MlaB component